MMSNTHTIIHIDGITRIKFLVRPSFEQVISIIDEIAENYPYEKRLWDLSAIKIDLTSVEIQRIAAYAKQKFTKPNKLAIFALDDLSFGEMRQFEVYREEENEFRLRIFRNEQDTIDWLNS